MPSGDVSTNPLPKHPNYTEKTILLEYPSYVDIPYSTHRVQTRTVLLYPPTALELRETQKEYPPTALELRETQKEYYYIAVNFVLPGF